MFLPLDHLIFGNGFGLRSPHCDNRFYWLSGRLYTFFPGLGAQLHSIQWTHPKPGEERVLCGRVFRVFRSTRRWGRVSVSWAWRDLPDNLDEAHAALRKLGSDLGSII